MKGLLRREEVFVRYAAKRTWPEQSKTWEYEGEAASLEDFALQFATNARLAAGNRFVVIEKGGDATLEFFTVAANSPYRLVAGDAPAEAPAGALRLADLRPLFMTGFNMIKVFAIALALVYLAIYGIQQFNS